MASHPALDPRRRLVLAAGSAAVAGVLLWPRGLSAQSRGRTKIRIGVIGAGHIGGTVGGLWVGAGHPVMFSSRDPEQVSALVAKLGPPARAGSVVEAIAFGEVVFLAVPYAAMPQIGHDYGAKLAGKIVLDAGNAIEARDGEITAEAEQNGIGATSQKYLPGARLVRAFNTLGYTILEREANRAEPRLAIPIAGDDAAAMQAAATLVRDAGFEPVIVGGLADAKRIQRGGPGYGLAMSAAELRKTLSLTR
ncbi:MAG: NAD(P)-binding domain-containing protein [Pseudomonadota bacterium]|nr:NAD(P)-binding domain-containing protein [Pseudomonadota bacterium]